MPSATGFIWRGGIDALGRLRDGHGPDVGWFAYVPLSGPQFGAGKRADIWAQMITFTEVSALAVAVEIVVTIFKQRAPGMSLDRIPLFVWSHAGHFVPCHLRDAGDHGRQHLADP